ncbi:hypothetical protein [Luteimonas sp. FCS-9]|uniref:hypothetical protein n=1 Tax=Luteimonas sp. FCS-9 TaxID=1547516 RepID=UPI0012E0A9E0|nr:hypothetical protein [Luteimonas sp. FCS-9]
MTDQVSFFGEAISFGYFSLGQQRKVTRSPAGEWKLCFSRKMARTREDQVLLGSGERLDDALSANGSRALRGGVRP